MTRYFHAYADGKTIKELDRETYVKYMNVYPNRKLVAVGFGFVNICSYQRTQWIDTSQLLRILEKIRKVP